MKIRKILFLFNPQSGKGTIRTKLYEVVDLMIKAGCSVVIHATQGKLDAKKVATKAEGKYDLIVCSGGDGTLDEVVGAVVQYKEKCPIGYIPSGSTNDFAVSLGLPKSIMKAADVAVNGQEFLCDVGNMNGEHFVYIAAFGLFTDVSYETPQEWKNLLGHAAYILEGAKSLSTIKSYAMCVECNGDVIEGDFIYGMVTNSTSVGGFKNMTGADVKLDDGLFEITLIRMPKNPKELSEILVSLTSKKDETDMVYTAKTDKIRFVSAEEIPWTMDGEFGGNHKEVNITNKKQAIRILIERKDEK